MKKESIAEDNPAISAMKKYSKMGLPIIPCLPKDKKPAIPGWVERLVTTEEEIDGWRFLWPNLNVGLPLGSGSKIIGIDIDGTEAFKVLQELSEGDLPSTWTFNTPGGGRRLLYQVSGTEKLKKWKRTLPGEHSEVALLGDGCQTILPPSIHPNSGKYKWIKGKKPGVIPIAKAPEWILKLMSRNGSLGDGCAEKVIQRQVPVNAKDGMQSDALAILRGKCHRFHEATIEQEEGGLPEEEWFLWIRLLVSSGHYDAAVEFSALSKKHDRRSSERIEKLIGEIGESGPLIRCLTFACQGETVQKCFGKINVTEDGEIANSPGTFIRKQSRVAPPQNPVYQRYVERLKQIPDFDIDSHGNLCGYDRKSQPFVISNFVAMPTLEVIRDDGASEERTFRVEGVIAGGKLLKAVDITAAEFTSMNWVMARWGIGATIRSGFGKRDMVRDAIQSMASDVDRLTIYTHLGFRKLNDARWVYLHASGCIGADDITVEPEKALEKYRLPEASIDPVKAAKASLKLLKLAPPKIMVPLLALVYLSPLTEVFRRCGNEPNFLVWLHGITGTRKTSLALVVMSHFGDFKTKSPPASFKDTANALEKRAFATKDTLLLIDDYHPETSKYESEKMAKTAQSILRMYGDRVARGRMKPTLEDQKSFTPRGMCLVTGEDIPQGQSSVARFIGVELLRDDVDLEVLTWAQQHAGMLSEAMFGYIQWLIPQMDSLPGRFSGSFNEKRQEYQIADTHGRLGEAVSWLSIAFEIMIQYMEEVGGCSRKESSRLIQDSDSVFKDLLQQQSSLVNIEKPAVIFLRALKELLAIGKVRIDPLKPTTVRGEFVSGERIGWKDDRFYYFFPEALFNEVSRALSIRGMKLPVLEKTMWKHLDEFGALHTEVGTEGRVQRCPKKTIPKGNRGEKIERYRLLHIKVGALEKLGEE